MVEKTATIQNANGIHCRPSAVIIKEAQDYAGEITIIAESGETDLRSVISLLCLGRSEGTTITIRVSGPDEAAFCARLVVLFETLFDFPPRDP
jgi:phosphocarrier protein HPr